MPYANYLTKLEAGRKWKRESPGREFVIGLKADRGNRCEDCGGVFPPYVLDWAHRDEHRATKAKILKQKGRGQSLQLLWMEADGKRKVSEEVAKCRLLCANCHRIETHDGGHWRRVISVPLSEHEDLQVPLLLEETR